MERPSLNMNFNFEESILVGCNDASCGLASRRLEGTSCLRSLEASIRH